MICLWNFIELIHKFITNLLIKFIINYQINRRENNLICFFKYTIFFKINSPLTQEKNILILLKIYLNFLFDLD